MSARTTAGLYLIEPFSPAGSMDPRLPSRMWSVSPCLSGVYPDESFLSWVHASPERDEEIRTRLGLDEPGLAEVRRWVTDRFESGSFGWPNVFLDVEAAREFAARWLAPSAGVRLLAISLADGEVEDFLAETRAPPAQGPLGIHQALTPGIELPHPGVVLGHEILGVESGGHFHSFVCNGLETDFMDRLGIGLNELGLIDDRGAALRAAEYVSREDVGAEPVPWRAWRVAEYGLPG